MVGPLRLVHDASDDASPDPTDEAVLIARAVRELRAFTPLYDRYADPVYRYCLRRLGDPEAAADVTGQVFAKALTALPRYRGGGFGAWLFAIARNVVTDDLRARGSSGRGAPLVRPGVEPSGDQADSDPGRTAVRPYRSPRPS